MLVHYNTHLKCFCEFFFPFRLYTLMEKKTNKKNLFFNTWFWDWTPEGDVFHHFISVNHTRNWHHSIKTRARMLGTRQSQFTRHHRVIHEHGAAFFKLILALIIIIIIIGWNKNLHPNSCRPSFVNIHSSIPMHPQLQYFCQHINVGNTFWVQV